MIFVETKEGWLVELGQEGLCEGVGSCVKYLKRGWNKKRGGETKILKRADKLGQGVGALKGGGTGNPLRTMVYKKDRSIPKHFSKTPPAGRPFCNINF